jgi:hypothetical protein
MGVDVVSISPDSLRQAVASFEVIACADRLILLDDLWTSAVSQLRELDREEVQSMLEEFASLATALRDGLDELGQRLPEFQRSLEEIGEAEVNEGLQELSDRASDGGAAFREMFHEQITEVGPYGAGNLACVYLAGNIESEKRLLDSKIALIRAGDAPEPDLSPPFRCALFMAKIAGVGVATVLTHGLVAFAVLIADRLDIAIAGWSRPGEPPCRAVWAQITGGRL